MELVQILNLFTNASGQRINTQKFGTIFRRKVPHYLRDQVCNVLHIQLWGELGKYLDILAQWHKSKNATLQWINELILNKMQGWKEKFLNQAGKKILIKATIQAIPANTMSVLKFPKKFCDYLCSKWPGSGGQVMGRKVVSNIGEVGS